MKYLVHFNVIRQGFFSDTTIQGTEVIEAEDLASAYEERNRNATNLNRMNEGSVLVTITKIESLTPQNSV